MKVIFSSQNALYRCLRCDKVTNDYGELFHDRAIRNVIESYCLHCSALHVAHYEQDGSWSLTLPALNALSN